jgi:hypothetical protein
MLGQFHFNSFFLNIWQRVTDVLRTISFERDGYRHTVSLADDSAQVGRSGQNFLKGGSVS